MNVCVTAWAWRRHIWEEHKRFFHEDHDIGEGVAADKGNYLCCNCVDKRQGFVRRQGQ
jgi:hypothetical protein